MSLRLRIMNALFDTKSSRAKLEELRKEADTDEGALNVLKFFHEKTARMLDQTDGVSKQAIEIMVIAFGHIIEQLEAKK